MSFRDAALLGLSSAIGIIGCSQAGGLTVPSPRAAILRNTSEAMAAQSAYAYACTPTANACYVFNSNGTLIKTVSRGLNMPQGTTTDPQGNWYVANSGAATVVEFSVGGRSVQRTLRDPGQVPVDIALSVSTNTVAVANAYTTRGVKPSVSVYAIGKTTPKAILFAGGAAQKALSVAFDRRGNCYLAVQEASGRFVMEFIGCAGDPKMVGPVGPINGITFGGADNLYYTFNGGSGGSIFRCTGVQRCSEFTPGFVNPSSLRFNGTFTALLVSDEANGQLDRVSLQGVVKPFASVNMPQGATFATGPAY